MFLYENILYKIKDGYQKCQSSGWVFYEDSLQGKYFSLSVEYKEIIYAQVIRIRTYQKVNGGPLKIHEYVKSQRFNNQPGKWYHVTTVDIVNYA